MTEEIASNPFGSEEKKLRWEIFNEHKRLAWANIQSSADSYDQSLLTLSSGGLGLSIAFIKDLVPLQHSIWLPLLYCSWFAFVGCILATVVSFQVSVAAQNEHIRHCQEYYIKEKEEYATKQGTCSIALKCCTRIAGAFFLAALLCTTLFAVENLRRASDMTRDKSGRSVVTDGRSPVALTPVPENPGEQRGRPTADMTPLPTKQEPQTANPTPPSIAAPNGQQAD